MIMMLPGYRPRSLVLLAMLVSLSPGFGDGRADDAAAAGTRHRVLVVAAPSCKDTRFKKLANCVPSARALAKSFRPLHYDVTLYEDAKDATAANVMAWLKKNAGP